MRGFMIKFLAFLVSLASGLASIFVLDWLILGLALIGMAILIPVS